MFQIQVVGKIKTHITFSNFLPENHAIYEIMSKDMAESWKPQTIWRMLFACWLIKATRAKAQARARERTPSHTHASTRMKSPRSLTHGSNGLGKARECSVTRILRVL